jgi:hypothetical protein
MLRILIVAVVLAFITPAFAQQTEETVRRTVDLSILGSTQQPKLIDITSLLQKIRDDAVASQADADSHQDKIASVCYAAIADVAGAKLQAQSVTGGGLLLAFQKLRDLGRLSASPQGTSLIIGCAPLVQDAGLNMLDFFTKIGAAVLVKGLLIP